MIYECCPLRQNYDDIRCHVYNIIAALAEGRPPYHGESPTGVRRGYASGQL